MEYNKAAAAFIYIICFIHYYIYVSHSLNSDGLSLLALKAAITIDPTHSLASWSETDSTPCHWEGITCNNLTHTVTSVSLSNRSFAGYIPSELGTILSLQSLSLSNNNFSKPIPLHLFNASNLLSLDLSHNSLTGHLTNHIASLKSLKHLDLSSNFLDGSLPEYLSNLTELSGTVNLSHNRFSGELPESYGRFPVLVSLDFRENNLTGKIPQVGSLLNQGPTAFTGNPGLCGFPLQVLCTEPEAQNPRVISDPENPKQINGFPKRERNVSIAVPLISAVTVIIGVVFVSVWVIRRKLKTNEGKMGKQRMENEANSEDGQKGKFVILDEGFSLEIEDLLRASAYVVGKSKSGIVYKVVVGRGSGVGGAVVAVRRLSEGDNTWRFKDFDAEVEAIGRVHHQNIVRLRAYYYAHDEKLLVSDYIGNGSLYAALHGEPSPTDMLPPLSWAVRLKIVQGIARALAHIHECSPRKYVHGNIKSSKVLLDADLQPYISGFGLTRLVSGISKSTNTGFRKHDLSQAIISPKNPASSSVHYIAPEARVSTSRFTQKSDVYSFGIVLLEILTGRTPDGGTENNDMNLENLVRKVFREENPLSEIIDSALRHEVHAKAQVVAAFHVALSCTEMDPEVRPKMRMVSDNLDRIKAQ